MSNDSISTPTTDSDSLSTALTWISALALVYLLLVAVSLVGAGFKLVSGGADGAAAIFYFASNPLYGVILGTLATALVQSSGTVTSVIVGLIAYGVPVSFVVPMILGANMGTTIINTIVSLGNLRPGWSNAWSAIGVGPWGTCYRFFSSYPALSSARST